MIGIIGAMDVEIEVIRAAMNDVEKQTIAGMDFYKGKIAGKEYVLVKCGIGKVNAGICVQILVDRYGVEGVVNEGIAGSLCNDLDIGDMVVSDTAIQHDFDLRIFGYKKGQLAGTSQRELHTESKLCEDVYRYLCKEETCKVVKGVVLSGDQFIADDQIKADLIEEFHGTCAEMEGAAIAQASVANKIPFTIIRAVSDKADGSGTVDYPTFEKKIANQMGNSVVKMIENNVF